ncbi:MAG: HAMP domain-containing histidine kinase [Oscillospiraceae bacterium]|nr:HAMP domain-containing histidine kinase [Oscillospiraceae bacterium]
MRFLRNKEVKQFLLLYVIVAAIATAIASFISLSAVVLVLAICVVSFLLFMLFTWKRYRAISNLSSQVDSVLHGEYDINLIPDEEGELAVLSSELSKMTLRLRDQADRLEKDKQYLSDSLADISHQLRTPLTSIRMIVPRLATDDQNEEQQANVRKVDALLNRTESLISTLLKIARLESGTVQFANEPVQVAVLLRNTLEPLEILLDVKSIELCCRIDKQATFVGDRLWTIEAIGNILKNCIEHCAEGGKMEIIASENPIYTEITIADNGTGFSAEDLPHLFDRFYRGSNAKKESAGIGLNLARMIITKQNGIIKAQNRPEGGAQFTIRFYKGAI